MRLGVSWIHLQQVDRAGAAVPEELDVERRRVEPYVLDHAGADVGHALDDLAGQGRRVLVAQEARPVGAEEGVDGAVDVHLPAGGPALKGELGSVDRLLGQACAAVPRRSPVAGRAGTGRTRNGLPVNPISSRITAAARANSSRSRTWNASTEAIDFTGFSHIGKRTPGGGRASSASRSTRPNAAFHRSPRAARAYPVLVLALHDGFEGGAAQPVSRAEDGDHRRDRKSRNPMIASTGPSKASSTDPARSSSRSKSISPCRSSSRESRRWNRYCAGWGVLAASGSSARPNRARTRSAACVPLRVLLVVGSFRKRPG